MHLGFISVITGTSKNGSWVGSLKAKQEHPFLPDAEIGESSFVSLFQAPQFTLKPDATFT